MKKLLSKLSVVAVVLCSSLFITASGGGIDLHPHLENENLEDANLNRKFEDLKFKFKEQDVSLEEAQQMFESEFSGVVSGKAKVEKLWFENGATSLVITESPLPMKILFNGYFLMDGPIKEYKTLEDKVGKVINFKVSNVKLVEVPVLPTLRKTKTDTDFWVYLTFTNYGKGNDGDFVDELKPDSIPY